MAPEGYFGSRFRKAVPGELCPCGRQARVVYRSSTLSGFELGYCGQSHDELDTSGPCPFCGGAWPTFGICPLYELRPLVTSPTVQTSKSKQGNQDDSQDDGEEGR